MTVQCLALLYHVLLGLRLSPGHVAERWGSLEAQMASFEVDAEPTYLLDRLVLEHHTQAALLGHATQEVALLDAAFLAIHNLGALVHATLGSFLGNSLAGAVGHGYQSIQVELVVVDKPQVACLHTQAVLATRREVVHESRPTPPPPFFPAATPTSFTMLSLAVIDAIIATAILSRVDDIDK
eukprot:CAMPEP_0169384966 /NCGR_PEP_ID=MMETSP1017-20121227/43784_1 /TAXON_ID=342587 /ORGANISM="Karlodinium micrum, Strain CCMP2283" /LENGTH=181 /DNA_ID=CAMNT_0009485709 /DNA_START=477 /DNA_END=1020 /DNA_ORIENTATION=-